MAQSPAEWRATNAPLVCHLLLLLFRSLSSGLLTWLERLIDDRHGSSRDTGLGVSACPCASSTCQLEAACCGRAKQTWKSLLARASARFWGSTSWPCWFSPGQAALTRARRNKLTLAARAESDARKPAGTIPLSPAYHCAARPREPVL